MCVHVCTGMYVCVCVIDSSPLLTDTMPKFRSKGEDGPEDSASSGARQRSKTVLGVFKAKIFRHRSSSVDSNEGTVSVKAKCATLPARVSSLDKEKDKKKPRTLFWMEDALGLLEGTHDNATVTRKDSDESVDSGFEQAHKAEGSGESDTNNSPSQSKALVSPSGASLQSYQCDAPIQGSRSMYDMAAVERAFGPMKDIGRWYSTYSSWQQLQQLRERPVRPVLPESPVLPDRPCDLDDEEDERLASRPLPPIPSDNKASNRKAGDLALLYDSESGDGVYERIELRMRGSNGLTLGLRNLARHGWYWGPITRIEAEERLNGTDDGTFLVRDSSDDRYLLSLSFRSQGKTLHTRIEYSNGFFSFYSFPDSESEGYRSVVELIERSMEYSRDGVFCFSRARALGSPAVPVRLLKALSRYNTVRSLQHYCRFVIRQSIRFDMIRELPLPRHVHGYLEQSQY